uniref:Uncharacterized protein n=1 Tax=Geospiza parvula TaxID=87175 RepID=A0A8C3MMV3_GEOPR
MPGLGASFLPKWGPAGPGGSSWDSRARNGPCSARPPALPVSQAGTEQPWGRCCCRLRAPQSCSCPVPLALSPAACMLCRRAEADPDMCGDKLQKGGLCAHVFCMVSGSGRSLHHCNGQLLPPSPHQLLPSAAALRHSTISRCCVCGQSGATIMCFVPECERWFHLPCAKEGGCVNVYVIPFRYLISLCGHPWGKIQHFSLSPSIFLQVLLSPPLSPGAMRAGLLYFQCPLCRDSEEFPVEMFVMGIRVPFRQPTWEDNNAFAELAERHSQCNARECLYPGGREEAEEEGPWELLLCSSCAAEGTHRRCSGLKNRIDRWECDTCAGLGTCMSQSPPCSWDMCCVAVFEQSHFSKAKKRRKRVRHCFECLRTTFTALLWI